MNRETDSTNSSETAISVLIPPSDPTLFKHKATSDVLLFFNIFEVEPPTSRSERSERVVGEENRHGTTQLPHCDQPTLKSISTVGYSLKTWMCVELPS